MNSVTALEKWKVKSFEIKKINTKDGAIEATTLDGTRYGIYTFADREYELVLVYLTEAELKGVEREFADLLLKNKKATFPLNWLLQFDFITFQTTQTVTLGITSESFKESKADMPKYFNLKIKFIERVRYDSL